MDSESVKKGIIQQILQESNMSNARQLLETTNQHCFESCVPKPGSSLTSSEQTCANQCAEKYIAAWNLVNTTYKRRVQQQLGNN